MSAPLGQAGIALTIAILALAQTAHADRSIVSARVIVDDYPPIALSVGEARPVAYPPGSPAVAFGDADVSATIPVDHANFGGGRLAPGTHKYRVEVVDDAGAVGSSATRYFRVEDPPMLAGYDWTICTLPWDRVSALPGTCAVVTPVALPAPAAEADIELPFNANLLTPGLKYLYLRFRDTAGREGQWREFVFEVGAYLALAGAEWTTDPSVGEGLATPIVIPTPAANYLTNISLTVPTASLGQGARRTVYLRVHQDTARRSAEPAPGATDPLWSDFASLGPINRCPELGLRTPTANALTGMAGSTQFSFSAVPRDADGDGLTTTLVVNGTAVATGAPPLPRVFNDAGVYTVLLRTFDGDCATDSAPWIVTIYESTGWMAR